MLQPRGIISYPRLGAAPPGPHRYESGEVRSIMALALFITIWSLRRFDLVWAAAGTPHAVFAIATDALIKAISSARVTSVS